jgi:excisionase family DNA binding protein
MSERKENDVPKRKTPGPTPKEPAPQQEFMTVAEVAALLRCDPRSVLNRIHDGDLDAVKDRRRWLIIVASYYRYKSNLRNRRRK